MAIQIIGLLIVLQGLTFSLSLLFGKARKNDGVSILTYLILTVAINFANLLLVEAGIVDHLFNFFGLYALSYGLLIRTYGSHLTSKKSTSIEFHPFFIVLMTLVLFYTIWQGFRGYKLQVLGYDDLETLPGMIYMFHSCYVSLRDYIIHKISSQLSLFLLICASLLSILSFIDFLSISSTSEELNRLVIVTIFIVVYLLTNVLVIQGLRLSSFDTRKGGLLNDKYSTSSLSADNIKDLSVQIDTYLKNSKSYLSADFDLSKMSKETSIPSRYISQVLNVHYKKNFFDLINSLRVEEAIKSFKEDFSARKSIKEVMYDVGFQSKSSFHKYFKTITGYTPGDFRKQLS